ncbi:MAG: hypothetical protein AVDCRST_MAG49-1505 [uncultured Thermomicrobiales bacterium]|uniref:Uncharacterized protein n=1 Tax=uncultured Thermomicrobiales bacterium TaxID=1645740 RepID=A0A6J4UE79_9BACT|nr:MAG: hypothetical protein AVDCRST_MAG49-1505 [uncultured Thermomicrobiales bacterium]
MRRLTELLTVTLLLGGLAAAARPAAAADPPAAQPYRFSGCETFGAPVEDPFSGVCYTNRGVGQRHTTTSGGFGYVINGDWCERVVVRGRVVSDYCERTHVVLVSRDGDEQVFQAAYRSEFSYEDGDTTYTCVSHSMYVYANGELRHEGYRTECDPPLPL